jgi:hypothetical protein
MKQNQKRNAKGRSVKSVLRIPDLEVAKSAVLNSLSCPDAQRGYRHAIDEFVDWYCSEPRLSFSKTVVLRYRMHLESRNLASGTVNLPSWSGAPSCVRGSRLRAPQRRLGRWDTTSQGRKETRRKAWQLVDCRAGASSVAGARLRADEG